IPTANTRCPAATISSFKASIASISSLECAGFWIIDVPNQEIALELAARGSKACNRRVELRPLLG
ncbi:MAG: hypothetical protein EBU45_05955, partial [Actinobacteria bacterium]|nr:hypothetical protein [Actinomycetota bacterium]